MSESSDDSDGGEWVFYRDRPEWSDVVPIKQDEGPMPVVKINYCDKFKDVYDYIRAVMKTEEISDRALSLTGDALKLNPANYSVWQYRRVILKELKKDLAAELEYVATMIGQYPKNYQVWHHRMIIVEWLNDSGKELEFLKQSMEQDPKNYHAWKHRQWVLKTFNLFENELNYTKQLIDEDVRNNSAWNQRYFVLNYTSKLNDRVALKEEINFAMTKILKATLNESPWSYMRGLLIHMEKGLLEPEVLEFCWNLYNTGNRSPHLLGYLVDACGESIDSKEGGGDVRLSKERGIEFCKLLAEKIDTVRTKYWNYMIDVLEAKHKNCLAPNGLDKEEESEFNGKMSTPEEMDELSENDQNEQETTV